MFGLKEPWATSDNYSRKRYAKISVLSSRESHFVAFLAHIVK